LLHHRVSQKCEAGVPDKYNPFRPNGTAPPGIFTGRYDELDVMEQYVILQRMAAERFAEAKAA